MKISALSSRFFPEALLCVLMLPLLFININHFHDWGDDFAQYILQAEVISKTLPGLPVSDVAGYSPGTKGILFSVLLAPAVLWCPEIITAGKVLVSLSLIFCGLMFYRFSLLKYRPVTAAIMTLFFVYNCHVLRLKDEVLPDLLFTGMMLAVLWLIRSGNQQKTALGLLLAGIATGFKSIGLVLVASIAIGIFFGMIQVAGDKRTKSIFMMLIPCFLIFILETISSHSKSGAAWYASVAFSNFDRLTMVSNFSSYRNAVGLLFEQEIPTGVNTVVRYLVFAGLTGGIFISFKSKLPVEAIFICLYFTAILIYPYNREPVRFIIPLLPFILMLIIDFYNYLLEVVLKRKIPVFPTLIALAFAGSQVITTFNEITRAKSYEPWTPESREMIAFVADQLPPGDTIAFQKPWAMAFFTGKHCVPADAAFRANYIVFNTSVADPGEFSNEQPVSMIFKNADYKIIKTK